jgi:histone acetyltransferase (RNA polymerase elongator complex component)
MLGLPGKQKRAKTSQSKIFRISWTAEMIKYFGFLGQSRMMSLYEKVICDTLTTQAYIDVWVSRYKARPKRARLRKIKKMFQ